MPIRHPSTPGRLKRGQLLHARQYTHAVAMAEKRRRCTDEDLFVLTYSTARGGYRQILVRAADPAQARERGDLRANVGDLLVACDDANRGDGDDRPTARRGRKGRRDH